MRYFGDYELLSEIARGGMGVVFRAHQVSLGRAVALKMIHGGALATSAGIKRFTQEARAAAQLDHPGIVPIYEVGEHEGQHYYSMKLIEGESLAGASRREPLRSRASAALLVKVSRAVHFAHERGIIHRDLKPANILLDREGNSYVSDFGLARNIHTDSSLTRTGAVVGTPGFMSPEQARGGSAPVGVPSDLYALGAVLYHTLTGRPPFLGATSMEVLKQVIEDEPPSPSQFNPECDRDLETVCLRCLEKDPAKRYPSAAALADDLERWLRGEPVLARRPSMVRHLGLWLRRRSMPVALVTLATLLLVLGGAAFLQQWRQRVESRSAAIWNRLELTGPLGRREAQALEELRLADPEVKLNCLAKVREDPGIAERFVRQPDVVVRSAAGLDLELRGRVVTSLVARALPGDADRSLKFAVARLGSALQAPAVLELLLKATWATSSGEAVVLGQDLAQLAATLTPEQAEAAVQPVLKAITTRRDPSSDRLRALGEGLAELAGRLDPEQAERALDPLLKALAASSDPSEVAAVGQGLARLTGRLTPEQAESAAESLLKGMEASNGPNQVGALGQGLAGLRLQLTPERAERALEPLLRAVAAASDRDHRELGALGEGLAALTGHLTPGQAERSLSPFLRIIEGSVDPDRNRYLPLNRFPGLADRMTPEQEARASPSSFPVDAMALLDQPTVLGQSLARLSGKLTPEQADGAFDSLSTAITAQSDHYRIRVLGQGLAGIVERLTSDQASRRMEPLFKTLAATNEGFQFRVLGKSYAALAGRLTPEEAERVLEAYLKAMATSDNFHTLPFLGEGLARLTGKLTPGQAARAVEPLLKAIEASNHQEGLSALGHGFSGLAIDLNDEQAARALEPFLKALASPIDPNLPTALGQSLAWLTRKLTPEQAARALEPLLKGAAGSDDPYRVSALGQGLAALRTALNDEQVSRAFEPFLRTMWAATGPDEARALGQGLAGVAGRLTPEQAERALLLLLKDLATITDPDRATVLGEGLEGLAERLTSEQAERMIGPLLKTTAATFHPSQIRARGRCLAGLARRLTAAQAKQAVEPFLGAITTMVDPQQPSGLCEGLAGLVSRLTDPSVAVSVVLKALDNPFAVGETTDLLVKALQDRFPAEFPPETGLWALVEWAHRQQ